MSAWAIINVIIGMDLYVMANLCIAYRISHLKREISERSAVYIHSASFFFRWFCLVVVFFFDGPGG